MNWIVEYFVGYLWNFGSWRANSIFSLILTAIVAVLLANSVFTQEAVSAPKRNSLLSKRANPNALKKTTTSTEAPNYEVGFN